MAKSIIQLKITCSCDTFALL